VLSTSEVLGQSHCDGQQGSNAPSRKRYGAGKQRVEALSLDDP